MADFYPGFNRIQIGGANPGAQGAAGFAKLGDMVGGGGEVAAQQAGAKAGYVGAETMNAIAQARQRQQEAQSRQQIGNMLDDDNSPVSQTLAAAGVTKGERATNAEMVRGGMPMGDIVGSILKNHQGLATMANGALGNVGPQLAAAAPAEAIKSVTPSAGVPQPNPLGLNVAGGPQNIAPTQAHLGAETGELNAKAGLEHNEQVNPQLYHPNMGVGNMNPDDLEAYAQGVAHGTLPPPTPGSRMFLAFGPQIFKRAEEINPNYRGYDFAANSREATGVQGGQTALNTDSSINRVGQHLQTLREAVSELHNGDVQPSNWLVQKFHELGGSGNPTKVSEIAQFIGAEAMKSAAQMSAGTKEEREGISAGLAVHNSPDQFNQDIGAIANLVKGQVTARDQQWKQTGHTDSYVMRNLAPSTRQSLGIADEAAAPAAKPGGAPAAPANQKAPGNGLPSVTDIDAELKRRGVQ
jgi:hypothetical protein